MACVAVYTLSSTNVIFAEPVVKAMGAFYRDVALSRQMLSAVSRLYRFAAQFTELSFNAVKTARPEIDNTFECYSMFNELLKTLKWNNNKGPVLFCLFIFVHVSQSINHIKVCRSTRVT
jgi:hypothetical protein